MPRLRTTSPTGTRGADYTSCQTCRTRRVKCDRAQPSCGWCVRNNQRCIYAGKRKPGPRKGHAQQLYNKVERLEQSVGSLTSQLREHIAPQPEIHRPVSSQDKHNRDSNFTGSYGHDTYLESVGLPPQAHLEVLVSLYFKHYNAWLHLLRHDTILELLKTPLELSQPDQILLHALVVSGLRYWMGPADVRDRYLDTSKKRIQIYAIQHANIRGLQALAILVVNILGDIHTVEAMNLLSIMAQNFLHLGLGSERRFDLGLYLDAPAGLTQGSSSTFRTKSWAQEEEARRLFWTVYSIDRYTTTCTSSDFAISERTVNRPLPCRYELWIAGERVDTRWYHPERPFEKIADEPKNLASFSYLCEVTRIMTRIHEFTKRPLDFFSPTEVNRWKTSYLDLDKQLSSWLNDLPGEYTTISDVHHPDTRGRMVSSWVTIQSGFILAAIRLHSAAAFPPMGSDLLRSSHTAVQKCMAAVTSMMRTAQDVLSAGLLQLLGPPFAGALWVVGRLLLVHASVPENELDVSIYFFISTLEKLGEHWPISKIFAQRLAHLVPHAAMDDGTESLQSLRR